MSEECSTIPDNCLVFDGDRLIRFNVASGGAIFALWNGRMLRPIVTLNRSNIERRPLSFCVSQVEFNKMWIERSMLGPVPTLKCSLKKAPSPLTGQWPLT